MLVARRAENALHVCLNFTTVLFALQDFFTSDFRFFFLLYTTPSLNFSFQLFVSGNRAIM